MSDRFQILEFSPMVVRDTHKEENIHLGSQQEARELCILLNTLWEKASVTEEYLAKQENIRKNQTISILQLTGRVQELEAQLRSLRTSRNQED